MEVALFARPAKLASLPASVSAEDRLVAALQRHANPQLLAKPPATYDAKKVVKKELKGLVR